MSKKINKDNVVLEIPQAIRQLAQKFRRQRLAKELAEKQLKKQRETEEKRLHATRLKAGWETATKVFLWAHALIESDVGQELMKKSHACLIFFDDTIIGVPRVLFGVSPNGLFLLTHMTHEGRGSHQQQYVYSPKDLAQFVHTVTLKLANQWVEDGKVWDCIKFRVERLKK